MLPAHAGEVPAAAVEHVAQQVGVPYERWPEYQWQGRTIEYHRSQIRFLLGFRRLHNYTRSAAFSKHGF
jgi:Domain of unknown function (DUF4158)